MQIELNKSEIETLQDSLTAYEQQPNDTALINTMIKSLFRLMLGKDPSESVNEDKFTAEKARQLAEQRKQQNSALRAKLHSAANFVAEHENVATVA